MSRTDPATSSALLTVQGLTKRFGARQVLGSVDLSVARGEVLAVIGSSGSGKTTLLRCLNGLEIPDGGAVTIADVAIDFTHPAPVADLRRLRDQSAMVFQHHNLFPHKTVMQNISEGPLAVQRRPREQVDGEVLGLLEQVGLSDLRDAYPFQLSGGEQQRVGILRAMALRPQLLLFDEPTSALDPELVGDVLALMRDLAYQGWSMVVVTHELQFARDVAHAVAFIDEGRIAELGPPAQVLGDPVQDRTRQFIRRLRHAV